MSEIRDLAPLMTSRDLLERLLATVDEVVNDEPARGSIRGCAITLAARLEQAEKALEHLTDNRSSLDRAYGFREEVERLRRRVSEAEHLAADQSQSADEWQERAEAAEARVDELAQLLVDWRPTREGTRPRFLTNCDPGDESDRK